MVIVCFSLSEIIILFFSLVKEMISYEKLKYYIKLDLVTFFQFWEFAMSLNFWA